MVLFAPLPATGIVSRSTPRQMSVTGGPSPSDWQYTTTRQPRSTRYSARCSAKVSKPPWAAGTPRVPRILSVRVATSLPHSGWLRATRGRAGRWPAMATGSLAGRSAEHLLHALQVLELVALRGFDER